MSQIRDKCVERIANEREPEKAREAVKSRSTEQKWKRANRTSLWNGFRLVSQQHLWNHLSNSRRQIIKEVIELHPLTPQITKSHLYLILQQRVNVPLFSWREIFSHWLGSEGIFGAKNAALFFFFFFFLTVIFGVVLHYVTAKASRTANFALEKEWEKKKKTENGLPMKTTW